jgi:hypothetical protein
VQVRRRYHQATNGVRASLSRNVLPWGSRTSLPLRMASTGSNSLPRHEQAACRNSSVTGPLIVAIRVPSQQA